MRRNEVENIHKQRINVGLRVMFNKQDTFEAVVDQNNGERLSSQEKPQTPGEN